MRLLRLLALLALAAVALLVAQTGAGEPTKAKPKPKPKPKPLCLGKRATIVGKAGPDLLNGNRRANVIVGLGGADTIDGRGGNDVICGGAGTDRLDGGEGVDRVDGGRGSDTCLRFESLRSCEETRDTLAPGTLTPGEYVTSGFTPAFSVTVPDGWGFGRTGAFIALYNKLNPGGHYLGFCVCDLQLSVVETVARISAIPGIEATTPQSATVGGAPGQRFDVSASASGGQIIFCTRGPIEAYFDPGDRGRIYVVDVHGTVLVIYMLAPGAEADAFVQEAEQVLATVQFA